MFKQQKIYASVRKKKLSLLVIGMFINPAWIVRRDGEEKRNSIKITKFIFTYLIMQEMCLRNR